tara:strand:+ start:44 stop:154 length:111 start_codon:yes stop_codon:yes gene_type:complete
MKPTVTLNPIKRFHADGMIFLEGFFPQVLKNSILKR